MPPSGIRVRAGEDERNNPMKISQYDHWVIREVLHNCIAHQDYSLKGQIYLVEIPSAVTLTNAGSFLPGTVETVIEHDAPPEIYLNPFLAEAMVSLNMKVDCSGLVKPKCLRNTQNMCLSEIRSSVRFYLMVI